MKSRVENLFNILCREAEQISVEKFAAQHNVTSRTVYKDLSTLNQLLISQGCASIQNVRGVLTYEDPVEIEFSELVKKDDIFYLDPEMRRRVILNLKCKRHIDFRASASYWGFEKYNPKRFG